MYIIFLDSYRLHERAKAQRSVSDFFITLSDTIHTVIMYLELFVTISISLSVIGLLLL